MQLQNDHIEFDDQDHHMKNIIIQNDLVINPTNEDELPQRELEDNANVHGESEPEQVQNTILQCSSRQFKPPSGGS